MDQCKHCTAREDFDKCRQTPCSHRENWGFREAVEQAHMSGQMDTGCKHPSYSNARAYFDHTHAQIEKLSGGTPSAQVPCSACGGTGQDDPPPDKYHGLCPACGGSGKQNSGDTPSAESDCLALRHRIADLEDGLR